MISTVILYTMDKLLHYLVEIIKYNTGRPVTWVSLILLIVDINIELTTTQREMMLMAYLVLISMQVLLSVRFLYQKRHSFASHITTIIFHIVAGVMFVKYKANNERLRTLQKWYLVLLIWFLLGYNWGVLKTLKLI